MADGEISDELMEKMFDEFERNNQEEKVRGFVPNTQVDEVSKSETQPRKHTARQRVNQPRRNPSKASSSAATTEFSSTDLLILVKSYIECDKRDLQLKKNGGGLTHEEFWSMITRLHNNHRSCTTTRTSAEILMAHRRFVKNCERYQMIIQVVEDENVFKTNRTTYDSRYLVDYGTDFVGLEAFELRCSWLTR